MPANPPQRYVLGLAYQSGPDPRIQRGADGGRDYFTADELERAAWQFMRGPREIGLNHTDGSIGVATAVESYIWRGEPWQVGDTVVKAGDWLLGVVCDEPTWDAVEKGLITGFSPQGVAKRRTPSQVTKASATLSQADIDFLRGMIPHHQAALDMSRAYLEKPDRDPRVTALAEGIISGQSAEIDTMTGWLKAAGAPLKATDSPAMSM